MNPRRHLTAILCILAVTLANAGEKAADETNAGAKKSGDAELPTYETAEQIRAMKPCESTVSSTHLCYAVLRTADGKEFTMGGSGNTAEVHGFLSTLKKGQVCKLPDAFLDYHHALVLALTSSNWSWENSDGGTRSVEDIQFYRDGFAQNPRFFTAHWEATGPRTVVLLNTNHGTARSGAKAYIVFDAAFTHFVGFDFNGKTIVEGFRREYLDPDRSAPQ